MRAPPTYRGRTAAIGVVAGLWWLAPGCAVDQDKEVSLYRSILNSTVPPVPPYTPDEPLSLQRTLALANQNNEQVALQGESYVQALIDKNRAVAAFLPTVSFQPSFTIEGRPSGSQAIPAGFRKSGSTVHSFQAPVVGSMNLFRGGGDVANLKAAEAVISQRRELLLDMQATVLINVAQVYYQVIRSEQSVNVLQNSLALQESRLADVEQQLRNGLATRLTVSQIRAELDATRVTLIQARADAANGRSTLSQLLGVPAVAGALTDEFVVPPAAAPEEEFEQTAISNRQDLLAAAAAIEAAKHRVDAAIAQYYPSVSVNVSGFLYREYYSDASLWSAILVANVPIFSAGTIRADVREAWSLLRQAALSESAMRHAVLHDVQTSYQNLLAANDRITELTDEVRASDDAYQQSRAAYSNGLATNLDVLTSQNQLLNAQLQLTSATLDRVIFYLDLLRACGRLHEVASPPSP